VMYRADPHMYPDWAPLDAQLPRPAYHGPHVERHINMLSGRCSGQCSVVGSYDASSCREGKGGGGSVQAAARCAAGAHAEMARSAWREYVLAAQHNCVEVASGRSYPVPMVHAACMPLR
jgi:hypothetical protein